MAQPATATQKPPSPAASLDPRAGTFRHEVWMRCLLVLAAAAVLAGWVWVLEDVARLRGRWEDVIYPPLIGFFAAAPEGILRRSWKMGGLALVLGAGFGAAGFWLSLATGEDRNHLRDVPLMLMCVGGGLGLAAGFGARSLMGALGGLFLGHLGGFLAGEIFLFNRSSQWLKELSLGFKAEIFLIVCMMLLPIGLGGGMGVWLGMRLGRRFGRQRNMKAED